jgi:hypothetical protein
VFQDTIPNLWLLVFNHVFPADRGVEFAQITHIVLNVNQLICLLSKITATNAREQTDSQETFAHLFQAVS